MADNQSPASPFFEPWEGNGAAMAADLGLKHVTVNQWRHRGSIPPQYWPLIIDKAAIKGATFTLEQFAAAFLTRVAA
jgi:hypothetical protein